MKNVAQIVATTRKYPKGKWTSDFRFIQYFASIYLVIAFTPFVSFLTVSVVAEKEKKIKETLRMVGMRDSAYWYARRVVVCLVRSALIYLTKVQLIFENFQRFYYSPNFQSLSIFCIRFYWNGGFHARDTLVS